MSTRAAWLPALRVAFAAAMLTAGCSGSGDGATPAAPLSIRLESPAIPPGGAVPTEFTCDGADRSPPLAWSGAPAGARAFAIIVEDPDAGGFVHWAAFDLPAGVTSLPGGASPGGDLPAGTREGRNDFGREGWGGPCPPRGKPHRYVFRVLALDAPLGLEAGTPGRRVRARATEHALAEGRFEATYGR
jgi:Raf kinase inhibitor-like YbhB/YbcL family protein